MKFEKDESGRIAILPFYLYVMRTVSFLLYSIMDPLSYQDLLFKCNPTCQSF